MTPTQQMAAHAAFGRLALQYCTECGKAQYPPRELCGACLADALEWRVSDAVGGVALAGTTLHHSHEPAFRTWPPLRVGLVRLDAGPTAVCLLAPGCEAGTRVRVTAGVDAEGRAVLSAAFGTSSFRPISPEKP